MDIYFEAPPPLLAEKGLYYSMPEFHRIRWNDPASFLQYINAIPT